MKNQQKTIRFWHYWNRSFTKISIKGDQVIKLYKRENTDEGWNSDYNKIYVEGDKLINKWVNDGRDCDGRLTRSGVQVARLDALQARQGENYTTGKEDVKFPDWESEGFRQFDEEAEKAGY